MNRIVSSSSLFRAASDCVIPQSSSRIPNTPFNNARTTATGHQSAGGLLYKSHVRAFHSRPPTKLDWSHRMRAIENLKLKKPVVKDHQGSVFCSFSFCNCTSFAMMNLDTIAENDLLRFMHP